MTIGINGRTKVFGIFGWPVEHSFSPAMHNAAFKHLRMDCVYVPFPVKPENLGKAVEGIRAMGISGANVTIPHKSNVIRYLDEVSPEAKLIGAVNTIVNREGVLTGYNTDAPGFVRSLEYDRGTVPNGKRVFILGAGGAARAVSIQLALSGASEIVLTSPVPEEVKELTETISSALPVKVKSVKWEKDEISVGLREADILINATPVGMHPQVNEIPPVSIAAIPDNVLVCDLIYNPDETLLLKKAKDSGLRTMNGKGMLLYQGAVAFELWTGKVPPLDIMEEALRKALTK